MDKTNELIRYSLIKKGLKREFLLLQGTGCIWRKCSFCDYHLDTSSDPFAVNKPVIDSITGLFGVADVINSGSVFELDDKTLAYLRERIYKTGIGTLWLETHWLYRERLDEIRSFFGRINVKFRVGVETFNPQIRMGWNKGIPEEITAKDIARYFDGICLLVCVKGQTRESILHDIRLAKENFEYFSVNVFCENSTYVRVDPELVRWFSHEVAGWLADEPRAEILFANTDLGVGDI